METRAERFARVEAHFQEMIRTYGWAMHAVFSEDGIHVNHHTHGVWENYKHLDFQIVLPVDQRVSHGVIAVAVERVKEGFKFESDKRYSNVLEKMDVLMKVFNEDNRKVLRIILPDPQGNLPGDEGFDEDYEIQLDVVK